MMRKGGRAVNGVEVLGNVVDGEKAKVESEKKSKGQKLKGNVFTRALSINYSVFFLPLFLSTFNLKDADNKEHKNKDNTDAEDNAPNHPHGLPTLFRVQLQPCTLFTQP
jgi:hypothetical protein